jgi:DNA repair protein RecN (Recombination protein N)
MLAALAIRDFALIDATELAPAPGLTVITGETGAGKSIVLDALRLALGSRAAGEPVRPGAARAELTAVFELPEDAAALGWLRAHELLDPDTPTQVILRRVLGADGRSRGFINGSAASLAQLRELAPLLVNLHGQDEAHALLGADAQLALLDAFGVAPALRERLGGAYAALSEAERELAALDAAERNRRERLDLLRYQLGELDELAPGAEEYAELDRAQRQLSAVEADLVDAQRAESLLSGTADGDDGAAAMLARSRDLLRRLADAWPTAGEAAALLDEAVIQVEEGSSRLAELVGRMEPDPERLAQLDSRLEAWNRLARKHQCEAGALAAVHERLAAEAATLTDADQAREALKARRQACLADYEAAAARVSDARRKAAARFSRAVTARLPALAMPGGRFTIELETREGPHALGAEKVRFMATANADRAPLPLNKGLSGGEVSRLSLACRVEAANRGHADCLIFDEADVGIGGATADTVGRLLRELADAVQVICVTHLPQVAAWGDAHAHVNKEAGRARQRSGKGASGGKPGDKDAGEKATRTQVAMLEEAARVEELARMLGGARVSDTSRAGARELLAQTRG